MRWISSRQQERDHAGHRDHCAACGQDGTSSEPLGLDDEGMRVHASHFTDPSSGLYGAQQSSTR